MKHLEKKSVTFYYRTPLVHKTVSQRFACGRLNVKEYQGISHVAAEQTELKKTRNQEKKRGSITLLPH